VTAAAAANRPRIMVEQVNQAFVIKSGAWHADWRMHAQGQHIVFSVLAIGTDHRWRQTVSLVERGRACGDISLSTKPYAFNAIAILEARQVTKQCVFEDRNEIALEENTSRLATRVLDDLDVMWCRRVSHHTSAAKCQRIGDRWKRTAAPPTPDCSDVNRMIGRDGIEVVPIWKATIG